MQIEPHLILFGDKGSDDWSFAPEVIAQLDAAPLGYLILEEEDEDQDPQDSESDWPVLPGNQIVWLDDGDEAEPLALVSADRAGHQDALEEVAREWARDDENVEIQVGSEGEVRAVYVAEE